jgi:secondary thiamine-phosphate synthase enzyme
MKTERLKFNTGRSRQIVDLTGDVQKFVQGEGDGLLSVSVPHATAGLALMELGSGSEADLWDRVDAIMPREDRYVHSHGSKGHGAEHLLPVFIAPTLTLPVIDGKVSLGTWQSLVMVDPNVDNPNRQVVLAFLSSSD